MITNIKKFEMDCTGCGACASACKKNAITMVQNNEGFLFPKIDLSKCIGCNDCSNVCHVLFSENKNEFSQRVYACQINDKKMLLDATAGGFFQLLSSKIIQSNGVVYGCAWSDNMEAVHQSAETMDGVKKFSGSKYVQSNISKIYHEIYHHVKNGKKVLFSGTPCQVDAIKIFCKDLDCSNLITVDVICYGVPSSELFLAYINKLNKLHNAKVVDFRFRDKKTYGWSHTTVITFQREDGSLFEIEEPNYSKIDYYKMFGARNCFRRSCYNCLYNKTDRVSDFTTGNYWGIEKKSKVFDERLGVSMVIINTKKASLLFDELSKEMIIESRTLDDAISSNKALIKGPDYPKYRDKIYKRFEKKGFDSTFYKYFQETAFTKLKSKIKKIIKRFLGRK